MNFNVRHNGEIISAPLSTTPTSPAFTIRWQGQTLYNELVAPSANNALPVQIRHNGSIYALSTEPTPQITETVTKSYQNFSKTVTGPPYTGYGYWERNPSATDWAWVEGNEGYNYVLFPLDFVYETEAHAEMVIAAGGICTAHFHVAKPKLIGLATNEELTEFIALDFQGYRRSNINNVLYLLDDWRDEGANGQDEGWRPRIGFDYERCLNYVNPDFNEYKCGIYNSNNFYTGYDEHGTSTTFGFDPSVKGRMEILFSVETSHHTLTIPVKWFQETVTLDPWGDGFLYVAEDNWEIDPTDSSFANQFFRVDNGAVWVGISAEPFVATDAFSGQFTPNLKVLSNGVEIAYTFREGTEDYSDSTRRIVIFSDPASIGDEIVIKWDTHHAVDYDDEYGEATVLPPRHSADG